MVNLARAIPGGIFCDPFSGVGGIAIEAGMIGCRVVAIDADRRMLRGAKKNMRQYELEALGYLNGDARTLPLHDLDSLATDPPYGRGSSTMGRKVASLIEDFLMEVRDVLKRRAHLCISAPAEVGVEQYAGAAGLLLRERHLAKIHRSLTRQFVVLQNP